MQNQIFSFRNDIEPWDNRMSACFQVLNEVTSGTPLGVSNLQHPHECPAFSGQIPVGLVFLDSSDGLVLKMSQVSSSKMKEKKKKNVVFG